MSLIAGVVHRDPAHPADAALLQAMAARVPGAGPPLTLVIGHVALLTGAGGKAPKRYVSAIAAADLDLVNLAELRALTGLTAGCEVLARLYELEGGPGLLKHLRGGFAVALWDPRQDTLWLGADHFGIKQLYYAETPHGLGFASRPSALLALPGVSGATDPQAVYDYLNVRAVTAPASVWKGVRRLPAGHLLALRRGAVTIEPFWDLEYPERRIGLREAIAGTTRHVEEAVTAALGGGSAKETGAFLSGGTDSSTVLGYMTRITGERIPAFSIGFREARFDEMHYADVAARHFNALHEKHNVTPDEALAAMPALVEAYDEPFGNNSAIGTFLCARLAQKAGVRRLLAGDGGDEIFGGNERYASDRIFGRYQRIPAPLRRGLIEPMLAALPGGLGVVDKARRYVRRANLSTARRLYSYAFFLAQDGRGLLAPELLAAVDADGPWRIVEGHFDRARAESELNRIMYLDVKVTLGDSDLVKVTRTAELAGIGVRFPFLDRPLVEFTGSLPADFKVRGLEKRYLFKRAFQPLLPAEILAKRKHGFGIPTSDWLKGHAGFRDLARETLLSPWARGLGYFRPGALERLFALHTADSTPYYGDQVWTALMLHLWHRRHLEGRAP
ncbi:MAG TPA: asparagine synthase-related protein [Methylomirabilota bacterium]|nr:asparagine synthase-related protein [Methylomirabilota bacterium]